MSRKSTKIHRYWPRNIRFISLLILAVSFWLFCFPIPTSADVAWSGDVIPDNPTTWDADTYGYIGKTGNGTMSITNASYVLGKYGRIGYESGTTGEVTVDGVGSMWNNESLIVGSQGSGVLNITAGGVVSSRWNTIGSEYRSIGVVTVDGVGSTWTNSTYLYVGRNGSGVLNITDSGLVSVAENLTIDERGNGASFINMATGGMLALYDDEDASASLGDFLNLLDPYFGTDAIRYWDYALGDWADITGGTLGEDFALDYITAPDDDLIGYTVLTVLEPTLLEGDANRDGIISAGDYATVQANFGNTGIPGIHGDANGDGFVTSSDYASVQANFGSVTASAPLSAAASTPEPATLSLLVLGGGAVILRRKRK